VTDLFLDLEVVEICCGFLLLICPDHFFAFGYLQCGLSRGTVEVFEGSWNFDFSFLVAAERWETPVSKNISLWYKCDLLRVRLGSRGWG